MRFAVPLKRDLRCALICGLRLAVSLWVVLRFENASLIITMEISNIRIHFVLISLNPVNSLNYLVHKTDHRKKSDSQ